MEIALYTLKINFYKTRWRYIIYAISMMFLIALYVLDILDMIQKNEFGGDYLAFWSAGAVADKYGYAAVYSRDVMTEMELSGLRNTGFDIENLYYLPFPYLPVFIIPFKYLSKIELVTSHWVWVITNWILLISYLVYFTRRIAPATVNKRILAVVAGAVAISYPTLYNFIWAQLEVLLVIAAGEFIRNSVRKKPFIAGAWIALLLIKPQLLILIVLALFILKNFDVLKGFLVSSLVLILISLAIAGIDGFYGMFKALFDLAPGVSAREPLIMMNWRMLGLRLGDFLTAPWNWVIAAGGAVATLWLCWRMVRTRPEFGTVQWVVMMMGIVAATCILTWHAHIHMAMILIPFILFGIVNRGISVHLVDEWVVLTPLVLFIVTATGLIFKIDFETYVIRYSNYFVSLLYLYLGLKMCLVISRPHSGEMLGVFER